MPQVTNPGLQMLLDTAQREEIPELVRHAPEGPVSAWLKQELPERGGNGHIPSHLDDVLVALVSVMAASLNDMRARIEELEERAEESARPRLPKGSPREASAPLSPETNEEIKEVE